MHLRRAVAQKILGQHLACKRRGLRGQTLLLCGHFSGHIARRIFVGTRWETAACRSCGRTEKRSPAWWSARPRQLSCRRAPRLRARAARGNRGPRDRASRPENARCARRSRRSKQSDSWRTDRRRGGRLRRNRMPPNRWEHRRSRAVYRPSCRPSCWPRRWFSTRPSARCRSRIRRDAEWCGTTSAVFRCARRRRAHRREKRAGFRTRGRPTIIRSL